MSADNPTKGKRVALETPKKSSDVPGVSRLPSPSPDMPTAHECERPTDYADRVGEWYSSGKSDSHRKGHGLFLTPPLVADFMASRVEVFGQHLRILDPAAGAGVLCCAVVEAVASRKPRPDTIELVAYETDAGLITPLLGVLDYLTCWSKCHGIRLVVRLNHSDFILSHADALDSHDSSSLLQQTTDEFDIVIANPPYFKINKKDPRAIAAAKVVHGQPNIYALFMAVGAALLRVGGDFIFITPRSFASGPYFRRFRNVFFDMIQPAKAHVFGSRRDAFHRDEVLQENVILSGIRRNCAVRAEGNASFIISSSHGLGDIGKPVGRRVPIQTILNRGSAEKIFRLPICDEDDEALALVDSWPENLLGLGLNISTGPVVPFRATELIDKIGSVPLSHSPFFWMNHVHAMRASWPLERRKPEYIRRSGARSLLVPNKNYVFLRRFSSKEEPRRLTAAPYLASTLAVPEIGIENHVNYVHRPGGSLSEDEAWGLAALYNSRLFDTWFRVVNGNTQVNATELRSMPLPAHNEIVALGQHVKRLPDPLEGLDSLVMDLVACPRAMEAAVGKH